MASKRGEDSGASTFCLELNEEGTTTLVVKGTAHTGMKGTHVCKSHRDNFSQFWCRPFQINEGRILLFNRFLEVCLEIDFSYLGDIIG